MAAVGFFTFGILKEPVNRPGSLGFASRTPYVFELADTAPGFLERWTYPRDAEAVPRRVPGCIDPKLDEDLRVAQTLSKWRDLESVFAFAYSGLHGEGLQHRKDWFMAGDWPTYTAWWMADDQRLTYIDALARFEHLRVHGPAPYAFDFRTAFGSDGQPVRIDRKHAMTLRQDVDPRALELATRFEQMHQEFTAELEGLTDEQWRTFCPGEERTVAALAHHIAWGYGVESGAFRAMAEGREAHAWARSALNQVNAEHAEQYADAPRDETMDLLQRSGEDAAAFVRALTAEQLQRRGDYVESYPTMTVDQWVERVLIGHITVHLRSIRATLGIATPTG